MVRLGYHLSSEEHGPNDLVRHARRAEDVGLEFAMISDHFHPWLDRQGESAFVWNVIGAIAHTTDRLQLGTGVTCPTMRIHPAIIAQATATAAAMMPGRFFLGVGTGENINEHILGDRWPPAAERIEMLKEAISVIRLLWQGGTQSHRGRYYTVENARIYSLPEKAPPIMMATAGKKITRLAGEIADGLINVAPQSELIEQFIEAGGDDKPRYGKMNVCWAESVAEARRLVHKVWPNAGLPGAILPELPTPAQFEQAVTMVREEDVADSMIGGPDPEPYIRQIREFADAGYTHVYLHQIGPNQEAFFRFFEQEIGPEFQ